MNHYFIKNGLAAVIMLSSLIGSGPLKSMEETEEAPSLVKQKNFNPSAGPLLGQAIENKNINEVKKAINLGADPDFIDNEAGITPLHSAAASGQTHIMMVLIVAGANINKKNSRGETPLHRAAFYSQKEAVQLLIRKGADVNACSLNGVTPLHNAAHSTPDIVEMLINAGASTTAKIIGKEAWFWFVKGIDNNEYAAGWTPLHCAAAYDHYKIAQILIKKGADPDNRDNEKRTPLDLAYLAHETLIQRFDTTTPANKKQKYNLEQTIRALKGEELLPELQPINSAANIQPSQEPRQQRRGLLQGLFGLHLFGGSGTGTK